MHNVFQKDDLNQKQNSVQENKSEKDCKDDDIQFLKTKT